MEMEGQKPPIKGQHLRWGILRPKFSSKYRGWKCGPNWGFKTHHATHSKPCVAALTRSALECRWCGSEVPTSFTGYLPFVGEDGQKLICLYGRDFEDIVSDIPYGGEIVITKGGYKSAPVVILSKEWCGHPCPWLGRLKVQADIRPFLLQLWKNDELKKFFGMEPVKIPVPMCESGAKKESDKGLSLREKFDQRTKQVEPSTNGNGRPHPKD